MAKNKTRSSKPVPLHKPLKAAPTAVKRATKLDVVIKLLCRKQGASVSDLAAATSWQPHTVRSVLSRTLKKNRGLKIVSATPKEGGKRIYRMATTMAGGKK
jgi:hypothetical protein